MDFNDWLKTETGKKCNDAWTIQDITGHVQPWLRNRLWWAFEAGVKSKESNRRLNEHIKELHNHIRLMKKQIRKQNRELRALYMKSKT